MVLIINELVLMYHNSRRNLCRQKKRDLTRGENHGDIGLAMVGISPMLRAEQGESLKRKSLVNRKSGTSDRALPLDGIHARSGQGNRGVSRDIVDKYLSEGKIPGFGLGNGWRLPATAIARHRKQQSRFGENQMRANLQAGRQG